MYVSCLYYEVANPYRIEFLRCCQTAPDDGETKRVTQQEQPLFNREGHKEHATAWMVFHRGFFRFDTPMPRGYKDSIYSGTIYVIENCAEKLCGLMGLESSLATVGKTVGKNDPQLINAFAGVSSAVKMHTLERFENA